MSSQLICALDRVHRQRNTTSINAQLVSELGVKVIVAARPFHEHATKVVQQCSTRLELLEHVWPLARCTAVDKLRASVARLDVQLNAAVFFTGGTTGTPKPVPHTHMGLAWLSERSLDVLPRGSSVCFTPYFHVMGFVANLVFNLYAGCGAYVLADADVAPSAPLMLQACEELRPAVLNTVPWVSMPRMSPCISSHGHGAHTRNCVNPTRPHQQPPV